MAEIKSEKLNVLLAVTDQLKKTYKNLVSDYSHFSGRNTLTFRWKI
jgi:hypothetical protein